MAGGCSPIRYLHNSSKSLSFTWKLLLQKTPRPTKINLPRNCSPPFGGTFWKSSQEIPALPNSATETPSEKTTATGFGRNFTSAIVCSTAFPAATKSSSTLGSMTKPPCEKPAQKQIRTRFSETCSHPAIRQAASVSSSAHPRKSPRRVGMNRGNSPRQSRRKPSDSLRGERNSAVQSMEIALTVPQRARPPHRYLRGLHPGWFYGIERSRPTFSSRLAPAKRSACAERNLSALCFHRRLPHASVLNVQFFTFP